MAELGSDEDRFGTRVPTQPTPLEYQVVDATEDGVKLLRLKTASGLTEVFLPKENARDLADKLTRKNSQDRATQRRDKRAEEKRLITPPSAQLLLPPSTRI